MLASLPWHWVRKPDREMMDIEIRKSTLATKALIEAENPDV